MPKFKNSNGTFWVIFKQRDSMLLSQQTLVYWYYTNEIFIELQKRPLGHPSFDVLINRNYRRRCLGFWDRKMWEEAFFKCLREKQGTPTKMSQFLRHLCLVSYRKLMVVQYQKLPLKISTFRIFFKREHIVWKILKILHLNFWILAFSTNFCPIKTDLSGNTVWPQASGFQNSPKWTILGIFN